MAIQPDFGFRIFDNAIGVQYDDNNRVRKVILVQYDHGNRVSRIWPATKGLPTLPTAQTPCLRQTQANRLIVQTAQVDWNEVARRRRLTIESEWQYSKNSTFDSSDPIITSKMTEGDGYIHLVEISGLDKDTEYWIRVRIKKVYQGVTIYSNWSETLHTSTLTSGASFLLPNPPNIIQLLQVSRTTTSISVTDRSTTFPIHQTIHEWQYSTDNFFTNSDPIVIVDVLRLTGLSPGESYWIRGRGRRTFRDGTVICSRWSPGFKISTLSSPPQQI